MKDDAVLLVERAHEIAELGAENALQRPRFRRDDMDLDAARAQRRRDFEPDEARADDDRAARASSRRDDGAAVGERAQRVDMRQVGAGDRQAHRLGAGREQQPVVRRRVSPPASTTCARRASMPATSRLETQIDVRSRRRNRPAAAAANPRARCRRDSPSTDSAGRPAAHRRR